ncbi:EamA family transporter [Streptomyces sp. NPDC051561]|uniref:EamA family transporter n=1 Tax=Streptomyces sp. NPDC051561 TaxID=3365658 RepID=UPI0037985A0B
MCFRGRRKRRPGGQAPIPLFVLAYPNTVIAYAVWNWLLKEYPVSAVAPLSLLAPVFGLLGSAVIFDERLSTPKLLCLALIVLGLITSLYGKRLANAVATLVRPASTDTLTRSS